MERKTHCMHGIGKSEYSSRACADRIKILVIEKTCADRNEMNHNQLTLIYTYVSVFYIH